MKAPKSLRPRKPIMLNTPLRRSLLRRRWTWLVAACAVLGLMYVVGVGWWKEWQVRRELDRLRAAGVPTSAHELDRYYSIPFGDPDATAAWMKPIGALSASALGRHPYGFPVLDTHGSWPPLPGNDWADLAKAEQYIIDHGQLFADIDDAAATPGHCCFVGDFSPGANLLLPHAQETRTITRLLAMRAFVHAHRGESAAVLNDINAMLSAADALVREPVMVTQLCRHASIRLALLTLEKLLPVLDESGVELQDFQERISTFDFHRSFESIVIGNRVLGLTSFSNPAAAGAGKMPRIFYRGWVRDHPLQLLDTMRELAEVLAKDWPAPLTIAIPFQENTWKQAQIKSPWGNQTWHAPTKFASTITSSIVTVANDDARARAAAACIAAVRFRRQFDRWPDSLEELVPDFIADVPLDPFTAEPLKLNVEGSEICIYSVGDNFQDDDGVELIEEKYGGVYRNGKPDVVFRVRMIPNEKD